MRAYGELLANVAKTVDQFAQDNITENNARDWLAQRFPDELESRHRADERRLRRGRRAGRRRNRGSSPGARTRSGARRRSPTQLQLAKPITDLSDEAQEQRARAPGAAADRAGPAAAAGLDGHARDQPDRGHRRAHPREGRVRHARAATRPQRASKASMYDRESQSTAVRREYELRRLVLPGQGIGVAEARSTSTSPPSSRRSTRPRSRWPR